MVNSVKVNESKKRFEGKELYVSSVSSFLHLGRADGSYEDWEWWDGVEWTKREVDSSQARICSIEAWPVALFLNLLKCVASGALQAFVTFCVPKREEQEKICTGTWERWNSSLTSLRNCLVVRDGARDASGLQASLSYTTESLHDVASVLLDSLSLFFLKEFIRSVSSSELLGLGSTELHTGSTIELFSPSLAFGSTFTLLANMRWYFAPCWDLAHYYNCELSQLRSLLINEWNFVILEMNDLWNPKYWTSRYCLVSISPCPLGSTLTGSFCFMMTERPTQTLCNESHGASGFPPWTSTMVCFNDASDTWSLCRDFLRSNICFWGCTFFAIRVLVLQMCYPSAAEVPDKSHGAIEDQSGLRAI